MSEHVLQSPVLLVQCCHLPQFFYIAKKLQRENPQLEIHALVGDHPQVRHYLELFDIFPKIHFDPGTAEELNSYRNVIFPLLNRGHMGLKRRAWKLTGRPWSCGYDGQLGPLALSKLAPSFVFSIHNTNPAFADFLRRFPHRPLREEILLVNSAHESLHELCDQPLKELLSEAGSLTTLNPSSFWQARRELKGKSFDGAIVFFSGELGFFHLKILPFLKRIPRIAVFNENGSYFYASWRSLARFWAQRFRYGTRLPRPTPCILLLQTEIKEYVAGAAKTLRRKHLYPDSRVVVLCKEEDQADLAAVPEIDLAIGYRRSNLLLKTYQVDRAFAPEIVSAVFSGRPVFRTGKLLFLGFSDRPKLAFNASLDCYWVTPRTFLRLGRGGALQYGLDQPQGSEVVLVQTEGLPYLKEVVKRVRGPKFNPKARLVVLAQSQDCNEIQTIMGVDEVIAWRKRSDFWSLRRQLKKRHPDAIFATFTGRPGHRLSKLFFLLFSGSAKGVFNARLDAYWLSLRTLRNLFRSEPLLFADDRQRRVLLLQTESWRNVAAAAERLSSEKLFPRAEVVVFCKEQDAERLLACPQVSRVLTFSGSKPGALHRDLRQIRRLQPDAISAIFSNRRTFPAVTLLFLLSRRAPKLVFNGRLDCYWLRIWNMPRLLRSKPLLFDDAGDESPSDVLLIQTEESGSTLSALDKMVREDAVPTRKVAVFCSQQERSHFESHPLVDRVFAYQKGAVGQTISLLWKLRRERWDVVVGLFMGRPVYQLQKLLFLFLPARHRLVFNPSLDCFYLSRNRLTQALRAPSLYVPRQGSSGAASEVLRKLIRGIMFLPRFVYLMAWLSVMKLRRARHTLKLS